MTFPSSFARSVVLCIVTFLISSAGSEAADNVARALQEALKARGFYTANPTGTMDAPTREALKRFQIREGLNVTGEPDTATLQALGNQPATKAGAAQNISVRERAQHVVASDREFLQRVEAMEESRGQTTRTNVGGEPETRTLPPVAAPPERTDRRKPVAPDRLRQPDTHEQTELRAGVSDDAAIGFVQSYLQAAQGASPAGEVAHYAESVDYFDSGKVSRDFVRKEQARYYRRWPERQFKLLAQPQIERKSNDSATVRFRVAYALRGDGEKASGRTENVVRVRREGSALRIVAIRERKLE
jgi:hypothetical protein